MLLFLPHYDLKKLNTLAVPAKALFFVRVNNNTELQEALTFAQTENLPLLFLGGGSNIILSDDFAGLVIQLAFLGKEVVGENDDSVWLKVAAGENWHELVQYTLDHALYGLENLSLIPGSVGAAPIQNIGAYGVELKNSFAELEAINISSRLPVTFTKESCQFGYRDSIFKHQLKDQYVITSVTFCLSKHPQLNINYPALNNVFENTPVDNITPQLVSEAIIHIRQSKLPDPALIPNVGSFFKNPIILLSELTTLKKRWPAIVFYDVDESHVKLAAAWLIDQLGWRGKKLDDVEVHLHQALVLINPHHVSGVKVLALANAIQQSVWAEFAVALEIEPRIYP